MPSDTTPQSIAALDGLAQSALVTSGEVSAAEMLEGAIARAEAMQPAINAICRPMYEEARAAVAEGLPQGPFHGLPILLKDIGAYYKGVPTSAGSRLFKDQPATHDSELVKRFKRAGAVIIGKSSTPEFGTLGTTEPKLFGPTRNPWNTAHSSGGSSGGSAAGVAARVVAIGHGGDGAGSIRIPASCCGLVGLKPTRARITNAPDVGEGLGGITTPGVLTRTVRDSAAMLDVLGYGPAVGDPYYPPPPAEPWLQALKKPIGTLKVAFTAHSLIGTTLHPDCVAAVEATAKLMESLGHTVVADAPPLDAETYDTTYRRFWPLVGSRIVRSVDQARGGVGAITEVEPINQYLCDISRRVTADDYLNDLNYFHARSRDFLGWMADNAYDVWLTPTLGLPPPKLGFFDAGIHGGAKVMDRFMDFLPFTPFANMTGQPAISVPLYWNAEGLPVGSQFFGRYADEATLLRLAAQLEEAQPWAGRRPPISC